MSPRRGCGIIRACPGRPGLSAATAFRTCSIVTLVMLTARTHCIENVAPGQGLWFGD